MRTALIASSIFGAIFIGALGSFGQEKQATNANSEPDWAMNATIIEACSCPMFCQCYFDIKPAAHAAKGHEGTKMAEVILKKNQGMSDEPIVIKNMKYWGATRNGGFVLMQNEVEALRQPPPGKEAFEFKGTNGFMITFDIDSKSVQAQKKETASAK